MRSEELFDEELDVAQSAGYQPDAELMSKLLITRLAVPSKDLKATSEFLVTFKRALSDNSDLKEEYRLLTKKLEEYLVWSMPFLYYDDADDAIISRDPSREQEILQTAKHLLDQIK